MVYIHMMGSYAEIMHMNCPWRILLFPFSLMKAMNEHGLKTHIIEVLIMQSNSQPNHCIKNSIPLPKCEFS